MHILLRGLLLWCSIGSLRSIRVESSVTDSEQMEDRLDTQNRSETITRRFAEARRLTRFRLAQFGLEEYGTDQLSCQWSDSTWLFFTVVSFIVVSLFVLLFLRPSATLEACDRSGDEKTQEGSSHAASGNRPLLRIPRKQWFWITSFQFVYSAIIVLMTTFVLPREAERMHKDSKSIWLSVYCMVSGSTQIFCPIIGKLSDRHSSPYGKRRPFIVGGMLMWLVSVFTLWRASVANSYSYLVSLFCSMFFLNFIYSAQSGIPADLQDKGSEEDTSGIASGFIGLHSFLGALSAMALVSMGLDVHALYPIGLLGVVIVSLLVCIVAPEIPSNHSDPLPFPTIAEMLQCFVIDLKHDLDFFWVCLGRLFFYIDTAFVVYIYYYLRDMIHIRDESERRHKLVTTILVAQVIGAIVSVISSWLSSQIGRKPVIYAASVLMSITHVLYMIAPKIGPEGSWSTIVVACIFYGAGCGSYLSVDYAMALDCLPSGKSSAEALGLWGVVGFLGSTIGPVVAGLLLKISSKPGPEGEEYGYVSYALGGLLIGVCMTILLVVVTVRIKGVA